MNRPLSLFRLMSALLLLLAVWPLSGRTEELLKPTLDADLPYQASRTDPVTYEVDFAVVVTAPYQTDVLKVWLPLPQTDAGQEVAEGELSTFPERVEPQIGREPRFGNQFAYFEFDHPQGAQIIRHQFRIKVWELRWQVDPARVAKVKDWPASFQRFLQTEQQSVVVDDRFRRLAQEIVPKRQGPAHDMTAVMAWVNDHLKYDHVFASLQASSENALKNRRGHCSDYHGLCASVGRALGYPTRLTYGINPLPKSSPSHCKLEVFLPPYGWVSFDVSETQNLIREIQQDPQLDSDRKEELIQAANRRLAGGFRDNTWFLQTRGTDYDLVPPASRRVPVVRTIYAEADGVALADPDPANPQKREFAWMTVHQYKADKPVSYPFQDWKSLLEGQ